MGSILGRSALYGTEPKVFGTSARCRSFAFAKPFGKVLEEARHIGQHVGRDDQCEVAFGWVTSAPNS
jgi:hypothetical protein